MEPNIIDFYNEMPQCVNVIEGMNKELSDLQDEYSILMKKYNELKNKYNGIDRIYFQSIEDRNKKHKEMLHNIKIKCNEFIDTYPSSLLYDYGFNSISMGGGIYACIQKELSKLTDDKNWVYSMTGEIINSLSFFRGREMSHWNKIYNSLTTDEIKDILFDHIEDYMESHVYTCYTFPGDDDY
jgi:hypothetical protein